MNQLDDFAMCLSVFATVRIWYVFRASPKLHEEPNFESMLWKLFCQTVWLFNKHTLVHGKNKRGFFYDGQIHWRTYGVGNINSDFLQYRTACQPFILIIFEVFTGGWRSCLQSAGNGDELTV